MTTEARPKTAPSERPPYGTQLRAFRRLRGMSQLDLAVAAGVSPRHVSFIESGRATPSRQMVLRLAECLDVPLRGRNDLLHLAGFAPVFSERRLDEPALAGVRNVIGLMLRQHEPYPAFVLDRYWSLVQTNDAAGRLFSALMPAAPADAVDMFLGPGPFREVVENWEEVAWVTLVRLRREAAAAGSDQRLRALLARAEALLDGVSVPVCLDAGGPTVIARLRLADRLVNTISTIAWFNAARDVTIDELHVELIYPADDDADAFFRESARAVG